jgi:hypothetical protein
MLSPRRNAPHAWSHTTQPYSEGRFYRFTPLERALLLAALSAEATQGLCVPVIGVDAVALAGAAVLLAHALKALFAALASALGGPATPIAAT